MSSNPYFQFHMQGNCWLVAYTEDLKRAILFHNLAFISQKHLVPFQIGKKEEKKKCQKRKKIKLVNHLFCFKIVLAKQMQKKKKKKSQSESALGFSWWRLTPHIIDINIVSRVNYIITMPLCHLLVIAEYSVVDRFR